MTCPHEEFHAEVDVHRITENDLDAPVYWYDVVLTLFCVNCLQTFRIVDPEIPAGMLAGRITANVTGQELHIPMWPADGTEPPKGKLAGFTIERLQ